MALPIVFLGPSLSHVDAQRFLDADYRPPVRRGDLAAATAGSVVAIVDGVFEQSFAVSPREIRTALKRGVRIFGSSSMGALRATEVPGVMGIGRIYEMFRTGEVEDDDEVAILFNPETLRPLSEPMVNVRHAVDRLARPGTISAETARAILHAAKRLPYRERTYPRILDAAGLWQRATGPQLAAMLASHDLKREDAITLLERLRATTPNEVRETSVARPSDGGALTQEDDAGDDGTAATMLAAEAPIFLWEFGAPIPFSEVVRFLACTGQLPRFARNAVARFALAGNEIDVDLDGGPSEEEVRDRVAAKISSAWVWSTQEETRASLGHLGIGTETFSDRLAEEVAAERRVMALARERSPEFLHALRVELFMNGLELKRAAARAMSLQFLSEKAAVRAARPLERETRDATSKLCELLDAKDLSEAVRILGWWGLSQPEVAAFIDLLARARRAATDLRSAATRLSRSPVRGLDGRFRARPKPPGARRFCTPTSTALAACQRLRAVVGITRVAMITGLADFGIPNAQAFRPDGSWSSTVGSGKSETVQGAKIGAVMEEVEKWAQEQFPRDGHAPREVVASYDELRRARRLVVDPRDVDLPFDSSFDPSAPIGWRPCGDLIGGKPVLVPSAMLVFPRLPGDICYSSHGGRKIMTTNGLASGLTLEEAITHALCECIERHGNILATVLDGNPGGAPRPVRREVALHTVPASTRKLIRKIEKASYSVRVLDISADVRVPTFAALISEPVPSGQKLFGYSRNLSRATACHPDPEVALNMSLQEAVQNVMTNVAAAREDLTLHARSLGRHERSASMTRSAFTAQRGVDLPSCSFSDIEGFVSRDARDDVRWVVERVRDAGYQRVLWADYTVPELLPARVVRVLVPGFETINPFYSGPQARLGLLGDLLPFVGGRGQ